MEKSLVSIVVTCYNHELYIEECLRSIFSQLYTNIELVVVNDGSTDRSKEVIERVLEESPFEKTTVIHQQNAGLVGARNRALSVITGEFVAFVDSDDRLEENYVSELMRAAVETNGDIFYTDMVNLETREICMKAQPFQLETFMTSNYISASALFRRQIAEGILYDNELNYKKLEDYEFWMNLILNKKAVPVYVETTFLNYRILDNSMSNRANTHYYYEIYAQLMKKHGHHHYDEVFGGLRNNIFSLDERLTDLIRHMKEVEQYVHSLQSENECMTSLAGQYEEQLKESMHHYAQLEQERNAILHSLSYRLGNKVIRTVKKLGVIKRIPGKLKREVKAMWGQLKRVYYKQSVPWVEKKKREKEARRSAFTHPIQNRTLIYVIYSSGEMLHSYKILFLEALAHLSQRVKIVVNGTLTPEDRQTLSGIGEVVERENHGYDTAAFREGILSLSDQEYEAIDQLVLVNDTNVGPLTDLQTVFDEMEQRHLDFWGISYGEEQPDFTGCNPYGYIPKHVQSYFIVVNQMMLADPAFRNYWRGLGDTNLRDKAIGRHETYFTQYFERLGYSWGTLLEDCEDSATYIHPLKLLEQGSPLVKYTALRNYDDLQFALQELDRTSQVEEAVDFIEKNSAFPVQIVRDIVESFKVKKEQKYVLIVDGVENIIPQCTRYRVLNKVEQFQSLGILARVVNASQLQLIDLRMASHVIVYRAPLTDRVKQVVEYAKRSHIPVWYDIDDLVFDTAYTDQLQYTKQLSSSEKRSYDATVKQYGQVLSLCDGAITSTAQLKEELERYTPHVLLNRNVASTELVRISSWYEKEPRSQESIKIGYFSGSITHNENFELVKPALSSIFETFDNVELHIVGHLTVPEDWNVYASRIVVHEYVDWKQLPQLIRQVDINIAPLVDSVFNRAKSEIKWIEASLVGVVTVASRLGAFEEMIQDGVTGILARDDEWYEKLAELIVSHERREALAAQANAYVKTHCVVEKHRDEMIRYVEASGNEME